MFNITRLIFLLSFIVLTYSASAQKTLKGQITDNATNTPLSYAAVIVNDSISTIADGGGFYTLTLDASQKVKKLSVSFVGYTTFIDTTFTFPDTDKATAIMDFKLSEVSSILGTVVVTGTNYEKSIIDEPTSIEVIKPDFFQRNNITGLDQVIERVPGIQIQDGQASIRSSGFSQGTGSRVGLIVDGMPMLGGDNSGIQWNFIPIENVQQVEVIKGAASVLYGSAAMNGVINVRTAFPTSEPYTNITLYSGVSSRPKERYRQWWDSPLETPRNHGIFVSHRQKFGKKVDFVIGGNTHRSIGHIEGENQERYRLNLKTRYRVTDKLNFTLEAYGMAYNQAAYLSWMDGDTNILRSLDPLSTNEYNDFSIALTGVYYGPYQIKHTARVRRFGSTFISSQDAARYPVAMNFGEYQAQKKFKDRFILTVGSSYQNYFANSLNFGRDSLGTAPEFDASITSVYAQGDFNAFDKKLNIIAGLRWEFIDAGIIDYSAAIPPIFRLSSTYKLNKNNILRFSGGQGYRFPSLYERFARIIYAEFALPFTETILQFGIKQNPDLLPEFGWSAELGYKHVLSIGDWNGYLDFAAFATRYRDMIYLTLDYHKDLGREFLLQDLEDDPEPFGYQFINLDNTLVAGFEIGSNFNGKIGNLPFRLWAGYTYTYPGDLDAIEENGENYFQNAVRAFTLKDSSLINSMLTYRSTHVAKFDIEFKYKPLTVGFSAIMDGFMHKIDPLLEGESLWSELIELFNGGSILPGVLEYRAENPGNSWSFDLKLAYQLSDNHQLFFIVSNMLNTTYAVRPGRINPLRTFNIKYSLTL